MEAYRRRTSPEPQTHHRLATMPGGCQPSMCVPTRGGRKNDFRNAEAIAEAAQRPVMKFVATNRRATRLAGAPPRARAVGQPSTGHLERGVAVRRPSDALPWGWNSYRTPLALVATRRSLVTPGDTPQNRCVET